MYFNTELGCDWFDVMLNPDASMQDKINELERVILQVPYTQGIEDLQVQQDYPNIGDVTYNVTIKTTLGNVELQPLAFAGA